MPLTTAEERFRYLQVSLKWAHIFSLITSIVVLNRYDILDKVNCDTLVLTALLIGGSLVYTGLSLFKNRYCILELILDLFFLIVHLTINSLLLSTYYEMKEPYERDAREIDEDFKNTNLYDKTSKPSVMNGANSLDINVYENSDVPMMFTIIMKITLVFLLVKLYLESREEIYENEIDLEVKAIPQCGIANNSISSSDTDSTIVIAEVQENYNLLNVPGEVAIEKAKKAVEKVAEKQVKSAGERVFENESKSAAGIVAEKVKDTDKDSVNVGQGAGEKDYQKQKCKSAVGNDSEKVGKGEDLKNSGKVGKGVGGKNSGMVDNYAFGRYSEKEGKDADGKDSKMEGKSVGVKYFVKEGKSGGGKDSEIVGKIIFLRYSENEHKDASDKDSKMKDKGAGGKDSEKVGKGNFERDFKREEKYTGGKVAVIESKSVSRKDSDKGDRGDDDGKGPSKEGKGDGREDSVNLGKGKGEKDSEKVDKDLFERISKKDIVCPIKEIIDSMMQGKDAAGKDSENAFKDADGKDSGKGKGCFRVSGVCDSASEGMMGSTGKDSEKEGKGTSGKVPKIESKGAGGRYSVKEGKHVSGKDSEKEGKDVFRKDSEKGKNAGEKDYVKVGKGAFGRCYETEGKSVGGEGYVKESNGAIGKDSEMKRKDAGRRDLKMEVKGSDGKQSVNVGKFTCEKNPEKESKSTDINVKGKENRDIKGKSSEKGTEEIYEIIAKQESRGPGEKVTKEMHKDIDLDTAAKNIIGILGKVTEKESKYPSRKIAEKEFKNPGGKFAFNIPEEISSKLAERENIWKSVEKEAKSVDRKGERKEAKNTERKTVLQNYREIRRYSTDQRAKIAGVKVIETKAKTVEGKAADKCPGEIHEKAAEGEAKGVCRKTKQARDTDGNVR